MATLGGLVMKRLHALAMAAILSATTATITFAADPAPPTVAKKPFQVTSPNGAREDDYYWLRDDTRKNPDMLAYLKAENAYADARLASTKPLQDKLYGEIVGRIKQDDSSVPYRQRGYWYYTRFETGKGLPNPRPAQRRYGCARRDHAQRGRDGRRQGLLPGGLAHGQPGQPPLGLCGRTTSGGANTCCTSRTSSPARPSPTWWTMWNRT